MENSKKNLIISILLAILIVSVIIAFAYFILNRESGESKSTLENLQNDSAIVSADPVRTAAKFIEVNATMGNVEEDITQESMKTHEATYENGTRRLKALEKIEEAVIPGNLLIIGNERDNIRNHVRDLDYPFLYEARNIEVSEPSEVEKRTVYSEVGATDYDSVTVKVDFESVRVNYDCPKDVSYAGVHTEITNIEKFEDVEVILVKSGELWFVYDVVNAETLINERFATWSGAGPSTIDYSKSVETGVFKIDGFVPEVPPITEETENTEEDTKIQNETEQDSNNENINDTEETTSNEGVNNDE